MRRNGTYRRLGTVALAAAGLALSGCGDLLDVSLPGSTPAEAVDDPVYAPILVVSALGRLEDGVNNYARDAGYIGGELIGGQSFLDTQHFRQRDLPLDGTDTRGRTYDFLSQSRWMADDAYARITKLTDAQVTGRTQLLGRAALYAGFAFTYFAEGFCSAAFNLGPELKAPAIFALAEARFTTALGHATTAGDAATVNAANIGLARVQLQLGKTTEALAAARKVTSTTFVLNATRSSASADRRNINFFENNAGTHSIDRNYWTTTYNGAADPRVPVVSANRIAGDGLTPLYFQRKYTAESSPIAIASWQEAQWIIAEIAGGAEAIAIINARHAALGLPLFPTNASAQQIKDQVIEERRREFFQDGHRLGDLRRFGGWEQWTDGLNPFVRFEYGKNRCFPLPKVERDQNPNVGPYKG
jgi:starch-binding outer membrane protein, SusD/RagB family